MIRLSRLFVVLTIFLIGASLRAQTLTNNILYSYKPIPITGGIEFGTGPTLWQNSATYFVTSYPFSNRNDTLHTWFPNGATTRYGFHAALAADLTLSRPWGLIAKISFDERRGSWLAKALVPYDSDGLPHTLPLISNFDWTIQGASLELYARYAFAPLNDLYVGAGASVTAIVSDESTLSQKIDGPDVFSFTNYATQQPTGIQNYSVTGSMSNLTGIQASFRFLLGYPITLGDRWSVNPEVTLAIPFVPLFNNAMQTEYTLNGVSSPPNAVSVTMLVAIRYQFQ